MPSSSEPTLHNDVEYLRQFRQRIVSEPPVEPIRMAGYGDRRYASLYLDHAKPSVVQSSYYAPMTNRHMISIAMPLHTKFEEFAHEDSNGRQWVDRNAHNPINAMEKMRETLKAYGVDIVDTGKSGMYTPAGTRYLEFQVTPETYELGMKVIDTIVNPESGKTTREVIAKLNAVTQEHHANGAASAMRIQRSVEHWEPDIGGVKKINLPSGMVAEAHTDLINAGIPNEHIAIKNGTNGTSEIYVRAESVDNLEHILRTGNTPAKSVLQSGFHSGAIEAAAATPGSSTHTRMKDLARRHEAAWNSITESESGKAMFNLNGNKATAEEYLKSYDLNPADYNIKERTNSKNERVTTLTFKEGTTLDSSPANQKLRNFALFSPEDRIQVPEKLLLTTAEIERNASNSRVSDGMQPKPAPAARPAIDLSGRPDAAVVTTMRGHSTLNFPMGTPPEAIRYRAGAVLQHYLDEGSLVINKVQSASLGNGIGGDKVSVLRIEVSDRFPPEHQEIVRRALSEQVRNMPVSQEYVNSPDAHQAKLKALQEASRTHVQVQPAQVQPPHQSFLNGKPTNALVAEYTSGHRTLDFSIGTQPTDVLQNLSKSSANGSDLQKAIQAGKVTVEQHASGSYTADGKKIVVMRVKPASDLPSAERAGVQSAITKHINDNPSLKTGHPTTVEAFLQADRHFKESKFPVVTLESPAAAPAPRAEMSGPNAPRGVPRPLYMGGVEGGEEFNPRYRPAAAPAPAELTPVQKLEKLEKFQAALRSGERNPPHHGIPDHQQRALQQNLFMPQNLATQEGIALARRYNDNVAPTELQNAAIEIAKTRLSAQGLHVSDEAKVRARPGEGGFVGTGDPFPNASSKAIKTVPTPTDARTVGAVGAGVSAWGLYKEWNDPNKNNISFAANTGAVGAGLASSLTKSEVASKALGRAALALGAVGVACTTYDAVMADDYYKAAGTVGGFGAALAGGAATASLAAKAPIPHPIAKGLFVAVATTGGAIFTGIVGEKLSKEAFGEHLQKMYDESTKKEIGELQNAAKPYETKLPELEANKAITDEYQKNLNDFNQLYEAAQTAPDRAKAIKALEESYDKLNASAEAVSKIKDTETAEHMGDFNNHNKAYDLLSKESLRKVPAEQGEAGEKTRQANIKELEGVYNKAGSVLNLQESISHTKLRAGDYTELAKEMVTSYGLKTAELAINKAGYKVNEGDGLHTLLEANEREMAKITARVEERDPPVDKDYVPTLTPQQQPSSGLPWERKESTQAILPTNSPPPAYQVATEIPKDSIVITAEQAKKSPAAWQEMVKTLGNPTYVNTPEHGWVAAFPGNNSNENKVGPVPAAEAAQTPEQKAQQAAQNVMPKTVTEANSPAESKPSVAANETSAQQKQSSLSAGRV